MRRSLLLIALFLVASPFVFAEVSPVADIANSLKGRVLTTRSFYSDFYLHYDASGEPLEDTHPGIWTTNSSVEVKAVHVGTKKVTLDCARLWVLFEGPAGEKRSLSRTDRTVEINIDLADRDTSARFGQALKRIFLQNGEPMADIVPPMWKPYFNGDEGVERYRKTMASPPPPRPSPPDSASKAEIESEAKPEEAPKPAPKLPTIVRISQGVARGLLVSQVRPTYPELARRARISGQVVMRGIISGEGDLRALYILKPAGAGLDEAAVESVLQWKYKPYMLMGQPVEVDTEFIVNFTLSR